MARLAGQSTLHNAKKNKSDEFYTQLCDIERELCYYSSHFKGKIIYCNCDDVIHSNFYKYFVENFEKLGIKKIICSCYKKRISGLLNLENITGFYYIYENGKSKFPSIHEVTKFYGDGDFRSRESIELLKQSDIIITNPPFSLFREFISQIVEYNKKFLVIGNINCITYKEIFNLIQNNNAWLGINLGRGISGFIVPKYYDLYGTETQIDKDGNRIISPNNCLWLTNLDNEIRHKFIPLNKKYIGHESEYKYYDNYNGININKTKDIPSDYTGIIGVPITFLHKFNPNQFEIIKFRKGDDEKDLRINGKATYFRILIRKKMTY